MKIELDGNMIFDDETGENICSLNEVQPYMIKSVIESLISDRDNLEDEILFLNAEIEKLQQEIDELNYYKDGGYSAY